MLEVSVPRRAAGPELGLVIPTTFFASLRADSVTSTRVIGVVKSLPTTTGALS
jgi:hypothetical protein